MTMWRELCAGRYFFLDVGDDLEALPRGVYVVNGRKVVR